MRKHQAMVAIGVAAFCLTACIRAARADSIVYADLNGTCAGMTPCYATVQEAVDHASDPDTAAGPLFAMVYVFPGTYAESVDLAGMDGGAPGDIQLATVDASGTPSPGTAFIDSPDGPAFHFEDDPFDDLFEGDVAIVGFGVHSANDGAIELFAYEILVDQITANGNSAGDGVVVRSEDDPVTIRNSIANDNKYLGFYAQSDYEDVSIDGCTADRNGEDGFRLYSGLHLSVLNSSATENESEGFELSSEDTMMLDNLEARDNNDGMDAGYEAFSRGNMLVNNALAAGNMIGFQLRCQADLTVHNSAAVNNMKDGVQVRVDGALTLDRVTSLGGMVNDGNGVTIDRASAGEYVDQVFILNSFVYGNGNHGISFDLLDPNGVFEVRGNIIDANGADGIYQFDGSKGLIDADGNWWGDASGPTDTTVPGGMGETVYFGGGSVGFESWIDQILAVASADPATVGEPVVVSIQYRESNSDLALGEGPGASIVDPPFSLKSSNGVVKTAEHTGAEIHGAVNKPDGVLEFEAIPSADGAMTVEADGPGKLDAKITVGVQRAPIIIGSSGESPAGCCGTGVAGSAPLLALGMFGLRFGVGRRRRMK